MTIQKNMPFLMLPHALLILQWHDMSVSYFIQLIDEAQLYPTQERNCAQTVVALGAELQIPRLRDVLQRFLFQDTHNDDPRDPNEIPLHECPLFEGRVKVYNSATAVFFAPSDISGIGGMKREIIRSCPSWRNGGARRDCAFVSARPWLPGMHGLDIVRVLALFSFTFLSKEYSCAVVCRFTLSDEPDDDTGMWIARPAFNRRRQHDISVINLHTIYHAVHLIPVYGGHQISPEIQPDNSYDAFHAYYVNKYADHHAFEITS